MNKDDFSNELELVSHFYDSEIDRTLLETHLHTLSAYFQQSSNHSETATLKDLKEFMANLTVSLKSLISQAVFVYKMVLLAPATNAVSERSCSALRRTKTWLRTMMNQDRLNHCLLLHAHQSLTEQINVESVAAEFIDGLDV